MRKRTICLLLAFFVLIGCAACGGSNGKYRSCANLGSVEYSIGFRNGDSTYHYIDRALKELSYEGKIDELSTKWFGSSDAVSFPSEENALEELGYIAPRNFIIGADMESAPLSFQSGSDYTGFDIELAQAVCEKLGWVLSIQPIHSEDAYVELNSGNIDCAWGGVALDTASADYTILRTYTSSEYILAGLGTSSGSVRDKQLYISTTDSALALLEEYSSVNRRLGQITRVNGGAQELFAALDAAECELILTTKAAMEYYSTH